MRSCSPFVADDTLQLAEDIVIVRDQDKAFLVEKLARFGKGEAAFFSFEQRHAERILQRFDLL